jgi:polyphosphate kinase 2 (PPK2 family)
MVGVFRVVALPAPSDREKSQMYVQRYEEAQRFLRLVPLYARSGSCRRWT